MPHKNGEVKIIKEIAATAKTKVSDSNKGKALQQSNKSLLTNGKSTMGEDGHQTKNSKQQQQNQGVKNTSNGHSNNNNLNGKYLKGNGIQLEQQQQIDHDPSVNSIQFEDSNDFSSHVDIPPQLQQNGHSNGEYLDIPNGHLSMSIMPSPPVKTAFPCYDPAIMTKLSDFTLYTNGLRDNNFDESEINRPKKIYRVVLTGGPCGGKTTGQARLCTFFESLGWKVFRVPETATVLLSGGIKFSELTAEQAIQFQEELIKTMMQIERSFFRLAETINRDVLIICDRGAMDASAYIPREVWEGILARNNWNEVDIRDGRYNHIIHMVSAANGAEPFYSTEDHICRSEGLELAQDLDQKAAQAWVGHPYFDVIDNSTDFESKLCRMIQVICKRAGVKVNEGVTSNRHWMLRMMGCVCQKLGIDTKDRLKNNSKKVKFLVKGPLPSDDMFPEYQDFNVVHDYLQTNTPKMQVRLRKRGQKGNWSYAYTVRHPELQGQVVEVRTPLTQRDYNNMLSQKEHNHMTVYKARRCFLLNDQYFQMDSYKDPCHPRCQGLIFLETYTTLPTSELLTRLPKFLNIVGEVTGDPKYSMFNLSLKERWENNKHFCQSLAGSDSEESLEELTTTEHRLVGC